jgi:hypothetical protein
VTRAGVEEQSRALAGVAVWNLAAPAVIRPHRDGWVIFMSGPGCGDLRRRKEGAPSVTA